MDSSLHPNDQIRDPLTGVYTRASLNWRLGDEVERARRYGQTLSLLLLDLDHFKSINDAFGHTRGDEVLVEFVGRLRAGIRGSDLIFRYGGDEFILLLPHTDKLDATLLAQRLLVRVGSTPFPGETPLSLSLSIGVANFPVDGQTPGALFEIADQRNYEAKRAGRGRVFSGESSLPEVSPLTEPSRLIERDQALETARRLLDALPGRGRGVLRVIGPAGSGKSRFLAEVGKVARLRGYIVLALCGKSALKSRVYGVLDEARQEWEGLPPPSRSAERLAAVLQQRVREKGHPGLLMVLDDLSDIDQATLDFVSNLFASPTISQLALVYAASTSAIPGGLSQVASFRESVTVMLAPITLVGLKIWIRHGLQWEAPPPVVEWLHHVTGGQPGFIRRGLAFLIEQEVLKRAADGWVCRPDFATCPLAEQLAQPPGSPRHNLPTGLTDFVGREEEIQRLKRLLQEQRLVTVVGPDGLGKTRLAIQAAAESLEKFSHGVCFMPLTSLTSADFMASALADALSFSLFGPQDPQTQLLNYLRGKEMLLVLDDFEHRRAGMPLLSEILDQAPEVKLLVTSRDRLALAREVPFELGGLAIPETETGGDAEDYSAVQLFLNCARRIHPHFSLAEADRPAVARICRLVEGMPLGIELAAAWIHAFSCQAIAAEIENNLAFLTPDQPTAPDGQHSLLAVFDSFWSLFFEAEQSVLRHLSVFRGGFSREAARPVAGASPFFLDALVVKSYLHRTPQGRYEMHELLRRYVAEKLRALPHEESPARDRHCEYYLALVEKREASLTRDKQAVEEIRAELENVQSAWSWAVTQARFDDLGRAVKGLSSFYQLAGLFREGDAILGNAADCLRLLIAPIEAPGRAVHRLLSNLLIEKANLLNRMARYDQAIAEVRAAIEPEQASQSADLEAAGCLAWGYALWRQADYATAHTHLERAITLARAAGSAQVEMDGLRHLGNIRLRQGDYAGAYTYYEHARRLYRETGDRWGESAVLNNLGIIFYSQGNYAEARPLYEQSLALSREIGDRYLESRSLNNLGELTLYQGDYAEAQAYYQQTLRFCTEIGDRQVESNTLINLGNVASHQGEHDRARLYLEQALQLCREIRDRWGETEALALLGLLAHRLGEDEAACEYSQQALSLALDLGARPEQALALTHLGLARLGLGRLEEAAVAYQQALRLRQELGEHNRAMEAHAGLARVNLARHDIAQAQVSVEKILKHLDTGTLDGTDDPIRVYLTCYRVLCAAQDSRAPHLLDMAHARLQERAARIGDERLRQLFLASVPSHQELMAEWAVRGVGR